MMKMQMVSAHMVKPTTKDCSHSPKSVHTFISSSRASRSAIWSARLMEVFPTMMPEALFTTLCAASNTPMTMFHVLDTMSTAAAVLNTHLKNTHVSMSWRLLRSAISCISSSVITKARITPAMGSIRLSERERIML